MRWRLLAAIASAWGAAVCISHAAGETSDVRSPVSPAESLRHLVVPPELTVELAAHEPDVIDPVALRFGEDGRMWVVEMRDYPTASTKGIRARSRISILRDRDGDGFFETSRVFADGLRYATGLQPWKGGVFVTMAGEVAYMKDTDGDDRADLVETWYTGFAEKNTQLRANHPRLALDNHIYIANGLRGGTVTDAKRPEADPVPISGMDFRFSPMTGHCEAVSGVGQFGLTFNDYGNRFICSNRNPAMHVVLEDRHLKKNPLLAVTAVTHDVARAGAESRLFPIGRSWTTSHLHAGQFTAACGVEVYRGNALPAEFYGNVFVCEPTGHLVHREVMEPHGVTFQSRSAADGVEFFASRDEWCSPVNLEIGPDGALYVVDMYRAVIEHPEWMPTELRQRSDLVAGNERGRIYRIVPKQFRRPAAPRLTTATSERLVELLAHPNAWWRETAARLLLERQDKRVRPQLEQMAQHHGSHLARIHALRLLEGLRVLSDELLARLLEDAHPRIVEQAIVAAESRVGDASGLRERIAAHVTHEDARVRFQALLAATPEPRAPVHPADRWEREAMLIAAGDRGGAALAEMLSQTVLLERHVSEPKKFVAALARLAAASPDGRQPVIAADALVGSREYLRVGIAALLATSPGSRLSLDGLRAKLDGPARRELALALERAALDATDVGQPEEIRCEAVDFLAIASSADETLASLAVRDPNQPVRLRAMAVLAKRDARQPWLRLLERFSSETPVIQRAILDGVLASADRTSLLLDEIAAGRMKPTEIDPARAQQLLNHGDQAIKARARELFADAIPADREQALATYREVLTMQADAARGRGVFEKHCATCHRVGGVGLDVAPDISDSREKSPGQLLIDIIQPNRAIDSNYFSYTVVTVDGVVQTGVLAAETSTSITLKQSDGRTITLRRDEIDELRSDGVSFMPEGLEKNIAPQAMADLISYLKNWRYLHDGS